MNGEELRRKVKGGGIVYGTMLARTRSPLWAEIIATWGLDYVIIDMEHTPFDRAGVADLLAGINKTDVVSIVRIPIPDAHYTTMALDAGAQGVLAPYCETVEEAKLVVGPARWRPLKGALGRMALDEGKFPSKATKDYLERRNKNTVCIIGIESVPGIENLDDILKIKGIDGIFVGPNDLSISLGVPDQYDHPKYQAALRRILSICQRHNTPCMFHHQTVEDTTKWLREGARFVLFTSDQRQISLSFREAFGAVKKVGVELGGDAVRGEEVAEKDL